MYLLKSFARKAIMLIVIVILLLLVMVKPVEASNRFNYRFDNRDFNFGVRAAREDLQVFWDRMMFRIGQGGSERERALTSLDRMKTFMITCYQAQGNGRFGPGNNRRPLSFDERDDFIRTLCDLLDEWGRIATTAPRVIELVDENPGYPGFDVCPTRADEFMFSRCIDERNRSRRLTGEDGNNAARNAGRICAGIVLDFIFEPQRRVSAVRGPPNEQNALVTMQHVFGAFHDAFDTGVMGRRPRAFIDVRDLDTGRNMRVQVDVDDGNCRPAKGLREPLTFF